MGKIPEIKQTARATNLADRISQAPPLPNSLQTRKGPLPSRYPRMGPRVRKQNHETTHKTHLYPHYICTAPEAETCGAHTNKKRKKYSCTGKDKLRMCEQVNKENQPRSRTQPRFLDQRKEKDGCLELLSSTVVFRCCLQILSSTSIFVTTIFSIDDFLAKRPRSDALGRARVAAFILSAPCSTNAVCSGPHCL